MKITIGSVVYHADTGVMETVEKTLEYIESPAPPVPDGYHIEEWNEETDTQFIVHREAVPDELNAEELLRIILGEEET